MLKLLKIYLKFQYDINLTMHFNHERLINFEYNFKIVIDNYFYVFVEFIFFKLLLIEQKINCTFNYNFYLSIHIQRLMIDKVLLFLNL